MRTKRRDFLKKAGAATVGLSLFPMIVKASALGRDGHIPPSDRLKTILIGCGRGLANLNNMMNFPEIQPVAVCDVDDNQISKAKKSVEEKRGITGFREYKDFREILTKEGADIAILGLPDHWHAVMAIFAANQGIHIYGEKPLARSIAEGRAIVDAVERNKIVWQTGSQQRSAGKFHKAAELVRNGRIGKVDYVEVGLPNGGHNVGNPLVKPVPDGVNWDMWLGPAPKVPFRGVLHKWWRWMTDYSGGQLTDWSGHHIDIAHWGLGLDRTGPVTIEGKGRPNNDGMFNVFVEYDFTCTYANGLKMRVASNSNLKRSGATWFSPNGWINVDRGRLLASDDNILKETIGENEIRLYKSTNHYRNFIECVKKGKETIAPAEVGHRSISVGLLGEIAMITGQKLHWDPMTEKFTDNNVYATRLLKKPYREPWILPG